MRYLIFILRSEKIGLTIQKEPPEVLCKIGVIKDFANFTRKHPCLSLFLIKLNIFLKHL